MSISALVLFFKFGKLGEGAGHDHLVNIGNVDRVASTVKLALKNVNDFFKLLRHKGISSYRVRYLQMIISPRCFSFRCATNRVSQVNLESEKSTEVSE